ncbi:unnamed protein product [Penicillium olsonii]|nr:unnamed protein product [Penicillium olsonii]
MKFNNLILVAIAVASYVGLKTITLLKNYAKARRSKFPIYVSPIPSRSIAWMILGPILRVRYRNYLPGWVSDRLDITTNGWEFLRTTEYHDKLGKTFVLVTPDECSLWQRQRRIVAPNLNERISETVWDESCLQAKDMLNYVVQNPGDHTLSGLRAIAKNVIGKAGYDTDKPWTQDEQSLPSGLENGSGGYFQAMSVIANNILPAALLPTWFMTLPIMPASLQLLGVHMDKVPQYMKAMLAAERDAVSEEPRDNFLSMLVRLSDQEKMSSGRFLNEREISGNLFTFTAAGFDTTANTMGYAAILLTVYPEWQDWIREELRVLDRDVTTWNYEDVYPKCQRVLAVMHETLRHFPPVMHSTRYVAQTQEVADSTGIHVLTASMEAYVSHQCIHRDPSIWGNDVLEFKPSRWIDSAGQIITPSKGTFLPWSSGPRICPGVKMAQVEFVATFATLFRSARCEPLPVGVQDLKAARQNLHDAMADSISKLTLQGKVYAVTGLGGIGLAVARQLHAQGAILSLADLSNDVLTTAQRTIEADFGASTASTIMTTVLDISNAAAVKEWVASTVSQFGRLDGAANMAGTIGKHHGTGKFVDQEDAEWDMLMRVNVTGLMYCLRAQLKAIAETAPGGQGSIVNASSIQGIRGFALHAAYSTTKHAVVGMTKSVAKEVGPNIRVNAVAPGSIQTPLLDMAKEIQGGITAPPTAIPRIGRAEEVAQTVVFLLSDAASYTTGQIISVDGGWDP